MQKTDHVYIDRKQFRMGTFRCPTQHPYFHNSGPTGGYLIVFPRTSVVITHAGKRPVVTDPNLVMFYNKGQEYFRDKVSEQGDYCEWYSFSSEMVINALKAYDPTVEERDERPFRFTHGPSDPALYFQQRLFFESIRQGAATDPLFIEERVMELLRRVIEQSYCVRYGRKTTCKQLTYSDRMALVQAVKAILATRFRERLTIHHIAQEVHSSPYHLCRIFRQITGLTIHNYLNRLRLHTSLEHIAQGEKSLTQLSHDLGYSSHSHFTAAFRRAFQLAPSEFRHRASTHHIQQMSKFLTV